MAEEKLKILYLMKILLEETDKDHILSAVALSEIMEKKYDLPCHRKTIYGDIERLQRFGLNIVQVKGDVQGYYVEDRTFSLPELKLLVDAVQSSRFITRRKSEELIGKLEKLTSRENARLLQRQVYIYDRPKADNETIFNNVDMIHIAMNQNRRITFKYCEWTVQKRLVQKKGGAVYEVSPWSLVWDDENYYLVAYEEAAGKLKHYRVDKMVDTRVTSIARTGKERFEGFDLPAFSKKTFGMYGGEDVNVTLECVNAMAGVMIDRFGRDIMMVPAGEGHFRIHVVVSVSPQFFGWLTGLGAQVQLLAPDRVRSEYRDYLQGILNNME